VSSVVVPEEDSLRSGFVEFYADGASASIISGGHEVGRRQIRGRFESGFDAFFFFCDYFHECLRHRRLF